MSESSTITSAEQILSSRTFLQDDEEQALVNVRLNRTENLFTVGDITNEASARASLQKASVNNLVAYIGALTGYSVRSVWDFAALAEFYPPEVRPQLIEYSPQQLRAAAKTHNLDEALSVLGQEIPRRKRKEEELPKSLIAEKIVVLAHEIEDIIKSENIPYRVIGKLRIVYDQLNELATEVRSKD